MRTYTIYQVNAFTNQLFTGNPAGVVYPADGLAEDEMQAIARELNNPETAFIFAPDAEDHDIQIRYFTPTTEVPICGHATIAAHYVRAIQERLPTSTVYQKTQVGILPVDIIHHDSHDLQIVMTQGEIEFSKPFSGNQCLAILDALGLSVKQLHSQCPVQIVSTGHSKVMIGVERDETLATLTPNPESLTQLSAEIGCNGYFVFAFASESDDVLTCGRMFAPAIGITEDPVTGNANGPLGAYLIHHHLVNFEEPVFRFKAQQGHHMGRPGVIDVTVRIHNGQATQVKVGGQAVIVFQTEITLS